MLVTQTKETYSWMNRVIDAIPEEKWDITPDALQTNVSWQVGHLVLGIYYNAIWAVAGMQMDVLTAMPLKDYAEWFTTGTTPQRAVGKVTPGALKAHVNIMARKSITLISSLPAGNLTDNIEPVLPAHPVAKSKFDAIDWNIKHTFWHCGQLGLLKRVVDTRFDFGSGK
ncbi:hypothetical protein FLA_0065 [Filimonas lacunae]|nr:hypothetical protein FLA_0065 [Filimonas lacunae]